MLDDKIRQDLDRFISTAKDEIAEYFNSVNLYHLEDAANIIWESRKNGGHLHVTGIGKPSYVASYVASLISSTGTPSFYLHGTEAVHGSCGQLEPGDVVICISNSGETEELKATATAVKNNGCKVIAVTANPESWLAKMADAKIIAGVKNEGGPLNRAPRTSIIVEMLALQCLSVILQSDRNLTPEEYVLRHPGGSLGKLRDNEKK